MDPWEMRDPLPARPDALVTELPATKRQNLLLSEIDELIRQTFGNSDEDRALLNAV
jgi:hypothetical protein